MVIDLTNSEKRTFFRFLFLYLGSSFVLLFLIAILYFQNEKNLYFELNKSNMQNELSKISNEIIVSHMKNLYFDKNKYLENTQYKISFYDENKNKIFGTLEEKLDFSQKLILNDRNFILCDDSMVGHLGIYYVALEDNSFLKKIDDLKIDILLLFVIVYMFIGLIGFYLAKLFLKPIKDEREKLNNFIKDTTHELNTPISAILMSLESENPSLKQLERAKISAKRVSDIYKDLTYIFLENRKNVDNLEMLQLKKEIEEQIEFFYPLSNKKRLEIFLNIENFSFQIEKDDFVRVFNNLLSNAVKYNKINGKIFVKLTKDGVLTIEDTGIGMDKNSLTDIFKRYHRATKQQGGFGLGLHIVDEICKKYKIDIFVDSIKDEGTIFKLRF